MDILITSDATRNKVVQYLKKEFKRFEGIVKTVAMDMGDLNLIIYEEDIFHLELRIDDLTYIDGLIEICKEEKIKTRVGEADKVHLFKNKNLFTLIGKVVEKIRFRQETLIYNGRGVIRHAYGI